jgi:hypothetical protein
MEQDALQALLREAAEKTVGGVPQSQARRPRLAEWAMLYLEWPTPGRFASPRFAVSRLFSCEPRGRQPGSASQNVPFAKSPGSYGLQPGVAREGEEDNASASAPEPSGTSAPWASTARGADRAIDGGTRSRQASPHLAPGRPRAPGGLLSSRDSAGHQPHLRLPTPPQGAGAAAAPAGGAHRYAQGAAAARGGGLKCGPGRWNNI